MRYWKRESALPRRRPRRTSSTAAVDARFTTESWYHEGGFDLPSVARMSVRTTKNLGKPGRPAGGSRAVVWAGAFGLGAFLLAHAGIRLNINGIPFLTDPREILVTLGAAITGPLYGAAIGAISAMGESPPGLRYYAMLQHVVSAVWVGWAYRCLHAKKSGQTWFYLGWAAIVAVYYFGTYLPVMAVTYHAFPSFFAQVAGEGTSLFSLIVFFYRGWLPEFAMTALVTCVVWAGLPCRMRRPLTTARAPSGFPDEEEDVRSPAGRRHRHVLAWRLGVWILLLALLPLGVMSVLNRQHTRDLLFQQESDRMVAVAATLAVHTGADGVPAASATDIFTHQQEDAGVLLFTVDRASMRLIWHVAPGLAASTEPGGLPADALESVRKGGRGSFVNQNRNVALGYAECSRGGAVVCAVSDGGRIEAEMAALDGRTFPAIAFSLLVIALAGSVIIYTIVAAPVETLTEAARAMSAENRRIPVPAREMDDEIRILADAFNHMTDRLFQLADLLPQTVFETDVEGRLTFMNRAGLVAFGITHQGLAAGVSLPSLFREALPAVLEAPPDAEGSPAPVEMTAVGADGTASDVLVYVSLRREGGRAAGVRGIMVDVTERRQAAERQSRLEEQLRQSQKMESIGRMAGGVAHDFNNLLTAILGNIDLALMDAHLPPRAVESLKEIEKISERAASLIQKLLSFSRKQMIAPRALDLNALLSDMQPMLERLIGEDVRLAVVLQPCRWVMADPGQVEHVLVNLVVNARDAMKNGGCLTVETRMVQVGSEHCLSHVDARAGQFVVLVVSDTGCGIPSELMANIFDPFFTTKPAGKGTGLGLAMVHGAVKQSGGWVEVHSQEGKGASFKIHLPPAERDEPSLPAGVQPPQEGQPAGTETVLLVEDDEAVRTSTCQILRCLGYTVYACSNVEEAIAATEVDRTIHVLITDVVLFGADGRTLAERVKRSIEDIRVLYTSGYTEEVVTRHGVLDPGVSFLAKPFTTQSLSRAVRQVLDSRQA